MVCRIWLLNVLEIFAVSVGLASNGYKKPINRTTFLLVKQ